MHHQGILKKCDFVDDKKVIKNDILFHNISDSEFLNADTKMALRGHARAALRAGRDRLRAGAAGALAGRYSERLRQ